MRTLKLGALLTVVAALAVPVVIRASGYLPGRSSGSVPHLLALARGNDVLLMNPSGGNRHILLRGGGKSGYAYPWFSWSLDGDYLLVVRAPTGRSAWTLLLASRDGKLLRTLATAARSTDFYPSWATDGDRVAYLAPNSGAQTSAYGVINTVDIHGNTAFLAKYPSTQGGCGGGITDPAQLLYYTQTGSGGMTLPLQWSISRHLAILGNTLVDTRTGAIRHLGQREPLEEAVLSRSGRVAATIRTCIRMQCSGRVVLVNPKRGAITRLVAPGELPRWSPDGRFVYFVRRAPGRLLHFKDATGNALTSQTYTSSIWRTNADGSGLRRLAAEDAYGFGFLNVTPDGRSLIFSRVDNARNLWRHQIAQNRLSRAFRHQYAPRIEVQRLDIGRPPTTLAVDAGLPSAQP